MKKKLPFIIVALLYALYFYAITVNDNLGVSIN